VVLLAHLLGAGAFGPNLPVRCLTRDPLCAAEVEAAAGVLGARTVRTEAAGSPVVITQLVPIRDGARDQVADWLDDLGLLQAGALERFVPESVASLPKAQVAVFLRHLWSAAGSVTVHRDGRGGAITYRSGSRRMLDDIGALLLRFGVCGTVTGPSTIAGLPTWTLEVVGLDDQRRFLQEIGLLGAQQPLARRLLSVVLARQDATAQARATLARGQVWGEVRQVLDPGPRPVLNHVPRQHTTSPLSAPVPQVPAALTSLDRVSSADRAGAADTRGLTDGQGAAGGLGVGPTPWVSLSSDGVLSMSSDPLVPGAPVLDAVTTEAVCALSDAPARAVLGQITSLLDAADFELDAVNDVTWDTVVSIEPLGDQQVFDATVLGAHNFVADGVVVHNSIEQDADMVILLHREDAYERESPRAGEADLIVAKHRNGPTDTITVAFQGHYSRFVDMQA
jgi:replicative DNA helicase